MFSGKKVVLTQPQEQDAKVLQQWYLNKEFRYWYDSYVSNSLEMIMDDIKQSQAITNPNAKKVDFIVRNKRDNEPIGVASIKEIDRQNGHAEIALGIADSDKRLAGFGVDLMIVLLDIVFYDFGFEKCYTKINDNNELGLKSALSFGFVGEGKLRKHIFMEGEYVDQWILGITKEEYEALSIVPRWKARNTKN